MTGGMVDRIADTLLGYDQGWAGAPRTSLDECETPSYYRGKARAVLMAMREPIDAMRWPMTATAWHSGSGQDIANVWRVGVDAALSDESQSA